MPTGYTAKMNEGKPETFEEFVLQCARAMGAFIMQRDDPMSDLPKMRQGSTFYATNLAKAKNDLHQWNKMDSDTKYSLWSDADLAARDSFEKRTAEQARIKATYESRLRELQAWEVPAMLESLKEFMIKQVKGSLEFDCYEITLYDPDFDTWEVEEGQRRIRSLSYAQDSYDEEVARVKEQNEYTALVYATLGIDYNDKE